LNTPQTLAARSNRPSPQSLLSTSGHVRRRHATSVGNAKQRSVASGVQSKCLTIYQCSGDHPACARCVTRGLICNYSARNPRARRSGVRGVSQDQEKHTRSLSDSRRASDSQEGSPASTSSALSGGAATPQNESNIRASNGMPMAHRPSSAAHYADSARAYRPYPSAGGTDSRNYMGDLDPSLRHSRSLDSVNGSPLDSLHYSYSQQPSNFEATNAYRQGHDYPDIQFTQGNTPGVSYACDPGYAPSIRSSGSGQSW
jgi:hypothetical protein